ncbi:GntR family transcriptional regulator [Croceitalea sp. MTPC5]|uniref:GntR family transcriptional regulator n=1 Tax=Croceitalea sp. MTPC5 TaxID=3056565 RepID=UPI002B3D3FEB|nr:GntR family transcriptional regulator [Croceitalea sp. MTPC5]
MRLIEFIKNLERVNALSKHEQLVLGIMDAINSGHLKVGSQLPSINVMVDEVGFARKTIVKAYEELKDKGLVESKKTKGYFVISNKTDVYLKIALIMYSFQRFQQEFYNALRKELEDKVQIDVFFHHNNDEVFETIFSNINGKYGMYIVAPIIGEKSKKILKTLSPEKLIVVDRFLDLGPDYTYVTQEFKESTYAILEKLMPKIKKYKRLVLFYRDDMDYPTGTLESLKNFASHNQLTLNISKNYESNSLSKDVMYFVISDSDLWLLLKDCKDRDFRIGKDVGVLSFNDHIVKELISGGITTISTDFKQMAVTTAQNIRALSFSKRIISTDLIERESM